VREKERTEKIQWHQGFRGGIEFELREFRDRLVYDPEYHLSKESLVMDLLIIYKRSDERLDHPIAGVFRKYNIVEYKSPKDGLTIDDYYKVIGYACLYKGLGKKVGEVSERELTVSIFRHTYPRKMFAMLKAAGANVYEASGGVFMVEGIVHFPTQVIVTSRLPREEHEALRILVEGADKNDVRNFLKKAETLQEQGDKNNVDAILQVSIQSNKALYTKLRREELGMCEAMEWLMKDVLDEREERGKEIGKEIGKKNGMERLKDAIMDIRGGLTDSDLKKKYDSETLKMARSIG